MREILIRKMTEDKHCPNCEAWRKLYQDLLKKYIELVKLHTKAYKIWARKPTPKGGGSVNR